MESVMKVREEWEMFMVYYLGREIRKILVRGTVEHSYPLFVSLHFQPDSS